MVKIGDLKEFSLVFRKDFPVCFKRNIPKHLNERFEGLFHQGLLSRYTLPSFLTLSFQKVQFFASDVV